MVEYFTRRYTELAKKKLGTDLLDPQLAYSIRFYCMGSVGMTREWASNADWCYWHFPMIEVSGKTAGIIGLGKIGVNTAKNCIITPHISWATKEARERIMQTTADNIKAFMDGAPVNVVNK